jgi:hypothetical protein
MIPDFKAHKNIPSLLDFKAATEEHQNRVLILGKALYQNFSNHFVELNIDIVSNFLKLHDYSKTSILPDGTNQIESLYQFYGVNKSDLPEAEKFKILSTINYINYLDSQKALVFFSETKLISKDGELTDAAHNLMLIERIADMVDRGEHASSTQEFNRKMAPASEILENEKWANYARYLEKNYAELIEIN